MKEVNEQDFLKTFGSKNMSALQKEVEDLRKGKFGEKMKELEDKINDFRNEMITEINKLVQKCNDLQKEISEDWNKLIKRINEVQEYANGLQRQINKIPR